MYIMTLCVYCDRAINPDKMSCIMVVSGKCFPGGGASAGGGPQHTQISCCQNLLCDRCPIFSEHGVSEINAQNALSISFIVLYEDDMARCR